MSVMVTILIYLGLAGLSLWLVSFAPRFVAAETGATLKATLANPAALGRRLMRAPWPFLSLKFWLYLWRGRLMLEFVIAVLVVSSAFRAASAFLKTAAAVPT